MNVTFVCIKAVNSQKILFEKKFCDCLKICTTETKAYFENLPPLNMTWFQILQFQYICSVGSTMLTSSAITQQNLNMSKLETGEPN